jgi:hypothetical protein
MPSGKSLKAVYKAITPGCLSENLLPSGNVPLYWHQPASPNKGFLNRTFNPSAAAGPAGEVVEQCRIGERIALHGQGDKAIVGSAIHACIALSFCNLDVMTEVADFEAILSGFGVQDQLSPDALHRQVGAFLEWIQTRWPGATTRAELAIQSIIETGQVINGRIDLLLELDEGWILIDHKSSQLASAHWKNLAEEYSGQLRGYSEAIQRASGKPVLESWLYLPVAGGAVRLEI